MDEIIAFKGTDGVEIDGTSRTLIRENGCILEDTPLTFTHFFCYFSFSKLFRVEHWAMVGQSFTSVAMCRAHI